MQSAQFIDCDDHLSPELDFNLISTITAPGQVNPENPIQYFLTN